jgi:hypothetical protein
VKSKGSPYKDGKFPSGTNWEDYILWCLVEMGKDCERAEAEKINSIAGSGDVGKGQEASSSTSDSLSDNNYYNPDGTFFKCGVGFLAWALWGHVPIHDSACMQSDLFGDGKINASFGRKTASRAQMRKLLIEQNAATVDNRRGRKRRVADEEEADNNLQTVEPPLFDSKAILAKTLQYLNADSWEKQRQKNAQLMIRSVRDKLTSRRRNEDSLGLELDRCYRNKRKPDQTLLDKQTAIENEIASLEQKLDELQGDKYRRHTDMINQQSLELAASSSDAATILRSSSSDSNPSQSLPLTHSKICRYESYGNQNRCRNNLFQE